eukprot:3811372-Pleurochrysis_carterae.AAC.4
MPQISHTCASGDEHSHSHAGVDANVGACAQTCARFRVHAYTHVHATKRDNQCISERVPSDRITISPKGKRKQPRSPWSPEVRQATCVRAPCPGTAPARTPCSPDERPRGVREVSLYNVRQWRVETDVEIEIV